MAKINRQTQKIFAGNANADEIAVFGSMKTGTPVYSSNIETLQSEAYTNGWSDALQEDKAPYLEEMNGVQYGLSTQIAYILQQGLAIEYDPNTTYFKGSVVSVINDTGNLFYESLTDDNLGNSVTDDVNWQLSPLSKITDLANAITALRAAVVLLTGNQTVAGVKTFTSAPIVPTVANATNNTQAASTAFVKNVLATSGNGFATFSKRTNGYIKFANNITIQWGTANEPANSSSYTTFPTAFTTACTAVTIGCKTGEGAQIRSTSKTNFQWKTGSNWGNDTTFYIAVGY